MMVLNVFNTILHVPIPQNKFFNFQWSSHGLPIFLNTSLHKIPGRFPDFIKVQKEIITLTTLLLHSKFRED